MRVPWYLILIIIFLAMLVVVLVTQVAPYISSLNVQLAARPPHPTPTLTTSAPTTVNQQPVCQAGHKSGRIKAEYAETGDIKGWTCLFSQDTCLADREGNWHSCTYPPSSDQPWPEKLSPDLMEAAKVVVPIDDEGRTD